MTSVQSYTGTASPYTFNGLVRHYFLRREPNLADLQVMLVDKDERREQSHAIAKRLRARLDPVAARLGARIQVVEVPPGPPVLQTLVAEVYGPDPARRLELARTVRDRRSSARRASSTSTGTSSRRSRRWRLEVDDEKAAAAGLSAAEVAAVVQMAARRRAGRPAARSGGPGGRAHRPALPQPTAHPLDAVRDDPSRSSARWRSAS